MEELDERVPKTRHQPDKDTRVFDVLSTIAAMQKYRCFKSLPCYGGKIEAAGNINFAAVLPTIRCRAQPFSGWLPITLRASTIRTIDIFNFTLTHF